MEELKVTGCRVQLLAERQLLALRVNVSSSCVNDN